MHRQFYFLLIIRIILLVLAIFLLAFIFGRQDMFFNHVILIVIILLQVLELIRFCNRTNRDLVRLFSAIEHSDFSITFQEGFRNNSFRALEEQLNKMILAYKMVKIEREAQYHLLQRLINQINVGILAVQDNTEISLLNPACENFLNVKGIRNWKLLTQFNPAFTNVVEELGENGRKVVEMRGGKETRILSIDVSTSILLDKPHRLIIVQDINNEVEQMEIQAWHKLIRILTHEIMNSVTPISSLTETTQSMLQRKGGSAKTTVELKDETISDILFSLKTIQKRSDGLLNFVDSYRQLSKVPKPVMQRVNLKELLLSVEKLMHEELAKDNIRVEMAFDSAQSELAMDRSQIEQVLINLITNSIHALKGRSEPTISFRVFDTTEHLVVEVQDNGKGIPEKQIGEIFVPFFSTRKDGSGIGLSLSRQIMNQHGGSIKVKSRMGQGASFNLNFPK